MEFYNIGDDSGDIEVQFSMSLIPFLQAHGKLDYINELNSWKQGYQISGLNDYLDLLNDEFKEFIKNHPSTYMPNRVRQALINAINIYNAGMIVWEKRVKTGSTDRTASPGNTKVSFYLSATDATHMKLRFG